MDGELRGDRRDGGDRGFGRNRGDIVCSVRLRVVVRMNTVYKCFVLKSRQGAESN